jgi:Domain of unknown function (DUF3850)
MPEVGELYEGARGSLYYYDGAALWRRAHELKCWPPQFKATRRGVKLFEYRKNDRNFTVSDILILREWEPGDEAYTGHVYHVRVLYVLRGPDFGVPDGFCVMSIEPLEVQP